MSEEFLRKHSEGEEVNQTVGEAVPVGQELFEDTGGKREYNARRREGKKNSSKESSSDGPEADGTVS